MVFKEKRVIAVVVVVLAVFLLVSSYKTGRRPHNPQAYAFPVTFGAWTGTDLTENIELLKSWLGTQFITFRNYQNGANGKVVTLYIAYYPDLDSADMAHSPEVCYPGQGWEVTGSDDTDIFLSGKRVSVKRMMIRKDSVDELVYSWWQTKDTIIAGNSRYHLFQLLNKISRRDTASLWVRVSTVSERGVGGSDHGKDVLTPFCSDISSLLANYFRQ